MDPLCAQDTGIGQHIMVSQPKPLPSDSFLFFASCSKSMSGCPDQGANQPRAEKLLLVLGEPGKAPRCLQKFKGYVFSSFCPASFLVLTLRSFVGQAGLEAAQESEKPLLPPPAWALGLCTPHSVLHPTAELLTPLSQPAPPRHWYPPHWAPTSPLCPPCQPRACTSTTRGRVSSSPGRGSTSSLLLPPLLLSASLARLVSLFHSNSTLRDVRNLH